MVYFFSIFPRKYKQLQMNAKTLMPVTEKGKIDWIAYVRTGWPIIVALIMLVFWFGGRMETPAAKESRVKLIAGDMIDKHLVATNSDLKQLLERMTRLETILIGYVEMGGNPQMHTRVERLEERMDSTLAVEAEETEILRRMADAIIEWTRQNPNSP